MATVLTNTVRDQKLPLGNGHCFDQHNTRLIILNHSIYLEMLPVWVLSGLIWAVYYCLCQLTLYRVLFGQSTTVCVS